MCVSFLSLCSNHKHTQPKKTNKNKTIKVAAYTGTDHKFMWEVERILCSGSHKATITRTVGAAIHIQGWGPCTSLLDAGRIHPLGLWGWGPVFCWLLTRDSPSFFKSLASPCLENVQYWPSAGSLGPGLDTYLICRTWYKVKIWNPMFKYQEKCFPSFHSLSPFLS